MRINKAEGFTLIELLAVIVILAIIALIATPIVLNIIRDSKENAGLRSAEMYIKGLETSIATSTLNNKKVPDKEYSILPDGNICLVELTNNTCSDDDTLEVEMNGEKPESGTVTVLNGKITQVELKYENGKKVVKDNNGNLIYNNDPELDYISLSNYQHKHKDGTIEEHEVTFDSNGHGTCSKCKEIVYAPGLYDEEWNLKLTWDELLVKDKYTTWFNPTTYMNEYVYYSILSVDEEGELISANGGSGNTTDYCSEYLVGNLVLDGSVKSLGYAAFRNCSGLKSIYMPDDIKGVAGEYVFSNCSSLTSIKIPDSVTGFSLNNTFSGCSSLTSVVLPNNVEYINGYEVFGNCENLTSITIPKSMKYIHFSTFMNSPNLKTINYLGTKSEWSSITIEFDLTEITVHCTDGDIVSAN